MRALLTALLAAISLPVAAQEYCAYVAKDGLVVEWSGGDDLRMTFKSGEISNCSVEQLSDEENLRFVSCPSHDLEVDMWLIPDHINGADWDILLVPPNALYWTCTVVGDVG